MYLRKAEACEIETVMQLYEGVKGQEGCTWDEYYPARDNALEDLASGGLYVLEDSAKIIGAVSVVGENELDDEGGWNVRENVREIARVAIAPEEQGQGLAAKMLEALLEKLRAEGCRAVHLLVAKENPPALRTYQKLGFDFLGDCFMYDHEYFMAEKIL